MQTQQVNFEKIAEGLYLLRLPFSGIWAGVYLHVGREVALIDSGPDAQGVDTYILPALRRLGLAPRDITLLLNTHTHGDHVGGHFRLKELCPHARVACTERGARKLRDPLHYNIAIRQRFPQDSPPPSYGLRGVETDELLSDGQCVDGLRLICTSGHDDDCVCFLHEGSGTLLTGDSVQQNGTDTQGMALYMYLDDYERSLRRLAQLGAEKIVCGHPFNPMGAVAEGSAACREYLESCLALTRRYDAFIRTFFEKSDDMRACAAALIGELGGVLPKHLFLALYTVSEHLKRMKTQKEYEK